MWLRSSIGKKVVMAVSGVVLFGFVLGHLIGNLIIFGGQAAFNAYAHKLDLMRPFVWVVRMILLTAVGAHVWTSIALSRENAAARPIGYRVRKDRETSFAARTMMISGSLVAAYIVYHLLHLTFRVTNPDISRGVINGSRDVYTMVVKSFQMPLISGIYLVGMTLLWFHLMHGLGSVFQTLGLNNERWLPRCQFGGRLVAALLYLGYVAIPLAVMFGFLRLPG